MASNFILKSRMKRFLNYGQRVYGTKSPGLKREFLTGFHKRKNERRWQAQRERLEQMKAEKLELRKQKRETLLQQRRLQLFPAFTQVTDPKVYSLTNHTVTVTDITQPGNDQITTDYTGNKESPEGTSSVPEKPSKVSEKVDKLKEKKLNQRIHSLLHQKKKKKKKKKVKTRQKMKKSQIKAKRKIKR